MSSPPDVSPLAATLAAAAAAAPLLLLVPFFLAIVFAFFVDHRQQGAPFPDEVFDGCLQLNVRGGSCSIAAPHVRRSFVVDSCAGQ